MVSKILPTEIISYVNKSCTWLKGSIFKEMNENVNTVYNKIVKYNNTFVNNSNIESVIPLSVCPCFHKRSYNCSLAHAYSIFPGQIYITNAINCSTTVEQCSFNNISSC